MILLRCLSVCLSGPNFLLNGLLAFGIVCQATLLIFLHSLHLSVQLSVLILVAFLISRSCSLHTGVIFRPMFTALFVSFSCVLSHIRILCLYFSLLLL